MASFFEQLSRRLTGDRRDAPGGRAYRCRCGRPVFFRNSECLACHTPLGYDCRQARLLPLEAGPEPGQWQEADGPQQQSGPGSGPQWYRRCANFDSPSGCNWLVPLDAADAGAHSLCVACRLNRTIPDLSIAENQLLWRRIETAKRRLVSQLVSLGLPVASRSEDPERGLAFDLLRAAPEGPRIVTGHDNGLITLDIEEADDVQREVVRKQMHEPYRTLLGHLRHEVGHYYWERLVAQSSWLEGFRQLYGDERADYAQALQRNYEQGPRGDWALSHVSSYASVHPWEDWAETWAHYLHMVDTVDTALRFGLDTGRAEVLTEPFGADSLWKSDAHDAQAFLDFVNAWVELTNVLNEMSRSMGQPDFYPFVLPRAAVAKLQFIHCVVADAAHEAGRAATPLPGLSAANPA
jgi:hypothetical protein